MSRFAILCLLPALLACESGTPDAPQVPLAVLEPELRIGSIDDPETMLTRPTAMFVDDEGSIYTTHRQEGRVLVHDRVGGRVLSIGRPGEGPGEFRTVAGVGRVGDTIWAFDRRLYRVSYFASDGRHLGDRRIEIDLGADPFAASPRPEGLLPTGELFGSPPAWSHEVVAGNITESPTFRLDSSGTPLDTLFVRPMENTVWSIQGDRSWGMYRQQPFSDGPLLALSSYEPAIFRVDRATATAEPEPTFMVTKQTYAGDTLFHRSYSYAPLAIDPAVPDSLATVFGEAAGQNRFPGAPSRSRALRMARERLYVPDHLPPVRSIRPGRDGTIWLQREDLPGDSAEWLVLGPDGEPLTRVTLPERLRVMVVERERLWGVEVDDLDVPYIVRYRLLRRDEGEPSVGSS